MFSLGSPNVLLMESNYSPNFCSKLLLPQIFRLPFLSFSLFQCVNQNWALLAPKVLLDCLRPMTTVHPSHPSIQSHPSTYSCEDDLSIEIQSNQPNQSNHWPPMSSNDLLWPPMTFNDLQWPPMTSNDLLWPPMTSDFWLWLNLTISYWPTNRLTTRQVDINRLQIDLS